MKRLLHRLTCPRYSQNETEFVLFNEAVSYQDYIASLIDEYTIWIKQWWNDNDRINRKYSGKKLSQCRNVYHKFLMYRPGIFEEFVEKGQFSKGGPCSLFNVTRRYTRPQAFMLDNMA
jgi:hypothetical protein